MTALPSTVSYVSSNTANLRVRLIGPPLDLARSMSDRWDVRVLRANGAVTLKLTPLRHGGTLLADYKPGGCDLTLRRPEDLCTFGPTPVRVQPAENGQHLLVATENELTPFVATRRNKMSPSSVVYRAPPKSIDQLILEMAQAREVISTAKRALGSDLELKIDEESGDLRITYVRVL